MDPATILIVDDESAVRDMMKSVLEMEGHRVLTAANGLEGLRRLAESTKVDVVLLDMMMPGMNGWEFLDQMKADTRTAKIPVIIVSAYHEIARSILPDAFVPKPIQLGTLLAAIRSAVA